MNDKKKNFIVGDLGFNPKDYWLAGWSYPQNINPTNTQKFDYTVSGIDKDGKKFFHKGTIEAETAEQARDLVERPRKQSGMRKIWCCIYVKKKMEVIEGDLF